MKFKKPENCKFDESTIPNMKALNYCFSQLTYKRNCIDAGGHIGTVSRILAKKFNHVYSFEPLFVKYLKQNTCYVGDTYTDYLTSKNAGINFIFARYGFGKNSLKFKYKINSFKELKKFIE